MGTLTQYSISAVLFKREDQWVGQCLQYDVAAQATTIDDLEYELVRTLMAHVVLDLENSVEPLTTLPRAPEEYWKMFDKGRELVAKTPPQFELPWPILECHDFSLRLA